MHTLKVHFKFCISPAEEHLETAQPEHTYKLKGLKHDSKDSTLQAFNKLVDSSILETQIYI